MHERFKNSIACGSGFNRTLAWKDVIKLTNLSLKVGVIILGVNGVRHAAAGGGNDLGT